MKFKYMAAITFFAFAVLLGAGLYSKTSYKDYNKEKEPLNHFSVGIFPDNLADTQIEIMQEVLDNSRHIIAARCEDTSKYLYSCAVQPVTVEQVFKGEGLKTGEKISIQTVSQIFMEKDLYVGGKPSLNIGFVNEMKPGKTYLIFLDRKIDTHNEEKIFVHPKETLIRPVFCYEKIENKPCVSNSDISNSTYYKDVSENEFFLASETTIKKIEEFKETLLHKYPIQ